MSNLDPVQILPSLLSADFARLGEEIAALEAVGCQMLHVDVMDGHFVPNITMGPPVVASIRKVTKLKLDVHLMITDAAGYARAFADAGADQISVHQEATPHLDGALRLIRGLGVKAGVVVNPSTPVSALDDVLELADFVLIMSVNPGFSGQKFIPNALNKVRQLAQTVRKKGLSIPIEIDGGITQANVTEVVEAGVQWMVAGSSVFGAPDPAAAFCAMRELAMGAGARRA